LDGDVKTFISLTWNEGIRDREAKVLVHTVAEALMRIGDRVGPWLQSQVMPTIRPFGDWVIMQMPRGSAYSSVDWFMDRCHSQGGSRIDGPTYLRLVELEPWQSSTPHFDVALFAEDLANAKGQSELHMALPGLAAVASAYHVRRLEGQDAQTVALRRLVAHSFGRAVGIPLPMRSGDVTSHGRDVYCARLCVMRPCTHPRQLLERNSGITEPPTLFCSACERDLEAVLIGSHYGFN
jgi:hypothetical protein